MRTTLIAHAILLALAGEATAAQWQLTRAGQLLPRTTSAKSQAFCTANPEVAVAFDELLAVTPVNSVSESAAPLTVTATLNVQAICLPGTTEIRLRYGDLPSSSASPITDYQSFVLAVASTPLQQFANPVSVTGTAALQLRNDTVEENTEIIDIGLLGGELILRDGGQTSLATIFPGTQAATTVSILDDDDLNAARINNTLNPLAAGDPVAAAAVAPFAASCAAEAALPATLQNAELIAQCRAILSRTTPTAVVSALRAISGEEISSQATSSQDNANFMTQGVAQRLAALRGGATSQSIEDLAFTINGQSVPGSAIASLLGWSAADDDMDSGSGAGLFGSHIGMFFSLTARDGERDANRFEVGFDYDGFQALAGLDYRFTDRFVSGVALGIGKLETALDLDAGYLDTQSLSGTWYGSWTPSEEWYADFAFGFMRNDYDQGRVVDLTQLGSGFARRLALGATDGTQWSLSSSVGYSLVWGDTALTPNARISYARTEIDGFSETGAGINDLIFPDQQFRSLQFALGAHLSRAISLQNGVLSPYLSLEIAREQQNDAYSFSPTLRLRPERPSTPVFINESDRNFGRGEAGLMYLRPNGLQFSLSYSSMLGYRDLSAHALQLSVRLEF